MRILSLLYARIKNVDVFNKKIFTALYSSAFACLMIIGVAQVGLRSTSTRHYFTNIDSYEGAYFEVTAEIPSEHDYAVNLIASGDNFEGAQLWLNGENYKPLTEGNNEIRISDFSVIEIYSPNGKVTVKLADLSNELVLYTADREITVENGLMVLGRIGIK